MSEIFAFRSADNEKFEYEMEDVTDYYIYSIYDPEDEDTYRVPGAREKINKAAKAIEPGEFELEQGEKWVHLDYQSIIDGEPERVKR
jgi:hypothetical protein